MPRRVWRAVVTQVIDTVEYCGGQVRPGLKFLDQALGRPLLTSVESGGPEVRWQEVAETR